MQLFRNELQIGFDKKDYSISVESLDIPNLTFAEPNVSCVLTCKSENQGFRLNGNLSCNLLIHCDRCLTEFQNHQDILFSLILTSQNDLHREENNEIIFFMEDMEHIDILSFIKDTIQLSMPMKILCEKSCEGLCSHCGVNLNLQSCDCKSRKGLTHFKELDHLISN